MAIELKIPASGESITEVVIGEWLKQEGDTASMDEAVALIETDKANVELFAPVTGTISQILKKAGETAGVGEVIGYMESSGDAAPAKPTKSAEPAEPVTQDMNAPEPKESQEAQLRITPSVRRAIREAGLTPEAIEPATPGRITMEDLERHQAQKSKPAQAPRPEAKAAKATPNTAPKAAAKPVQPAEGSRAEEVVAMTPMRKRIAARLVEAQQSAALLTTFNEVDMSAVIALRKRYKERFIQEHGVKLGFMSFFVKAAVEALKAFPAINAEIRGEEIIYKDYYDIGVAVGGGRGLVVPILRNAERMSFAQVERTIGDFGVRAKENKLKVNELQGGTFTISNGGIYGSLMSTPIVNPPQSGILGMHAIQERPVVRDGQIQIGQMMYIALTYDHRLVDGREAVSFLVRIKECVEHPERLLLEV